LSPIDPCVQWLVDDTDLLDSSVVEGLFKTRANTAAPFTIADSPVRPARSAAQIGGLPPAPIAGPAACLISPA
jgi:hypothetical protein